MAILPQVGWLVFGPLPSHPPWLRQRVSGNVGGSCSGNSASFDLRSCHGKLPWDNICNLIDLLPLPLVIRIDVRRTWALCRPPHVFALLIHFAFTLTFLVQPAFVAKVADRLVGRLGVGRHAALFRRSFLAKTFPLAHCGIPWSRHDSFATNSIEKRKYGYRYYAIHATKSPKVRM